MANRIRIHFMGGWGRDGWSGRGGDMAMAAADIDS